MRPRPCTHPFIASPLRFTLPPTPQDTTERAGKLQEANTAYSARQRSLEAQLRDESAQVAR